jgi:coenzyme F420-reducing hydrogenase delta subunit
LKTRLPEVGLDPARLEMYNLSAAEGPTWARICTEFTERIKNLGPSPIWWAIRERSGKE